jgi:hypothetical protein
MPVAMTVRERAVRVVDVGNMIGSKIIKGSNLPHYLRGNGQCDDTLFTTIVPVIVKAKTRKNATSSRIITR